MISTKKKWAIAVSVGVVSIFAWSMTRSPLEVVTNSGYAFVPGTTTEYAFEHRQTGSVRLGVDVDQGADVPSAVDLALAFEVRGIASSGGEQEVELRLVRFDRTELTILGQNVLPPADELMNATAAVHIDGRNRFVDVRFEDGSSIAARRLLQLVLAELQLTLPESPASSWSVEEQTPHGVAVSRHLAGPTGIERTRERYASLQALTAFTGLPDVIDVDGRTTFEIDPNGTLQSLQSHESIEASRRDQQVLTVRQSTSIRFVERSASRPTTPNLAFAKPRPLFQPIVSADSKNHALRQRAKGMTVAQVVADVRSLGALQRRPDHNAWFTRAVAALKLDPAAVEALRPVYAEAKTLRGREVVLDLLAWTGHDEAQALLVELIDGTSTREHRSGHGLLQRLSMVRHPNLGVLAFVEQEAFQGRGHFQTGALYAAGSASRKAIQSGTADEKVAAQQIVERLEAGLRSAQDPRTRAHFVTAIGNVALPQHASLIIGETRHTSANVRAHAASALHRFDTEETRGVLIHLAADPARAVQQRALATLVKSDRMTDAEIEQLAVGVRTQSIREEVLPILLNAMLPYTVKTRAARAVLSAIADRDFQGDPSVQTRAALLLARPETR